MQKKYQCGFIFPKTFSKQFLAHVELVSKHNAEWQTTLLCKRNRQVL